MHEDGRTEPALHLAATSREGFTSSVPWMPYARDTLA